MKHKTLLAIAVAGLVLLALVYPATPTAKKTDTRISTAVNNIVTVPVAKAP